LKNFYRSPFSKWPPQFRKNSTLSDFNANVYAVFWQPFWKWQTSRQFWKRRIAPLMVTYHYVKFYVSIIIDLEVININVRNFKFPITNSTLSNFNDISYVGRLWCPELIPDIEKFLAVAITIPHKFNIVWFQRPELIPDIDKFLPVSMRPLEIFRCQESIRDIIIYPHMKCRWNWTMLNLCGIVVTILKMATGRNLSMSGINSGHHNLPTYQMALKSDNVEKFLAVAITIPHKFNIVWFQRPELIPDIDKFLPVSIFKMATKIQHCSISKVAFDLFFKPDLQQACL
jgi:hypothetical protein